MSRQGASALEVAGTISASDENLAGPHPPHIPAQGEATGHTGPEEEIHKKTTAAIGRGIYLPPVRWWYQVKVSMVIGKNVEQINKIPFGADNILVWGGVGFGK